MVVLALISDPPVITKILQHLRLPTEPPPLAPVRASWELQPPLVLTSPGNDHAPGDPAIIASEEEILIPSPPAALSAAACPNGLVCSDLAVDGGGLLGNGIGVEAPARLLADPFRHAAAQPLILQQPADLPGTGFDVTQREKEGGLSVSNHVRHSAHGGRDSG
jgi:hypothetical protein